MTTFKIMYWQEIPVQIVADDGFDEVKLELDARFMARVDQLAHERGLIDTDAYLEQWHWGDETEREGTAEDVARAVKQELEAVADG